MTLRKNLLGMAQPEFSQISAAIAAIHRPTGETERDLGQLKVAHSL